MEQQDKKHFWNSKWFLYTVGIFFGVIILGSLVGNKNPSSTPVSTPAPIKSASAPTFATLSRARFDDILKSASELKAINCIDSDCSDVVYFDYNTIPSDLGLVVRGNAATFSKFKLDNTGVSNVSIIARFNGRTILTCSAGQGKVKECH